MAATAEQVLTDLARAKRYELSDVEATAWTQMVDAYGDDAVVRFVNWHIRTSPFFPSVSAGYQFLSCGFGEPSAAMARLCEAVRDSGPYVSPDFRGDLPLGQAVLELGGWARVCELLPDPVARSMDFAVFEKRFSDIYRRCVSKVAMGQVDTRALVGLADAVVGIGMTREVE